MFMRKLALLVAAIAIMGSTLSLCAQQPDSEEEGQLRFRFVGPRVGNRIASVGGCAGRSQHLLRRRCLRWRLEIDGRRQPLDAHLR